MDSESATTVVAEDESTPEELENSDAVISTESQSSEPKMHSTTESTTPLQGLSSEPAPVPQQLKSSSTNRDSVPQTIMDNPLMLEMLQDQARRQSELASDINDTARNIGLFKAMHL